MARNAPTDKLDREVYVTAAVVIVGVIMSVLDMTIVNVALETLSRDLHTGLNTVQWVSTAYLLAVACVIPLTGWATERFGSKQVWMTCVLLFGLGSALCGLAWSAGSLIFFRVLQGVGGGMIMPVGMSVMAQTAGPKRIGRVMSVVGVPMLLGPILGPVLGGLIVDNASWRWIFYVNVPVAIVALFLARRLLHPAQGRADAGRLDWRGLALLSPGLGLIVFGLSESESHGGFSHPMVLAPVVVGLVLVAGFVVHSLRTSRPLIDVRLFREPSFAAAAATTTLLGGALFGAMIILPLYYQVDRGEPALTAGLLMAPQGLGAAIAMPIAGRLTDRIGGAVVAVFGLIILPLATVPHAFVTSQSSYALLAGLLVVRGFGLGSTMMPTMAAAYAVLAPGQVPRATSALNVTRQIGGSLGTAVLAVLLQHEIRTALPGAAGGGEVRRLPEEVRAQVAAPLADAFAHTFAWAVAVSAVAIVPAVVLLIVSPRGPPDGEPQARGTRGAGPRPGAPGPWPGAQA